MQVALPNQLLPLPLLLLEPLLFIVEHNGSSHIEIRRRQGVWGMGLPTGVGVGGGEGWEVVESSKLEGRVGFSFF